MLKFGTNNEEINNQGSLQLIELKEVKKDDFNNILEINIAPAIFHGQLNDGRFREKIKWDYENFYKITFSNYRAYKVSDKNNIVNSDEYVKYDGKVLVIGYNTSFLEQTKSISFNQDELVHYGMILEDRIIDVVADNEPTIEKVDIEKEISQKYEKTLKLIEKQNFKVENGLNNSEISKIEEIYNFKFPLSLKLFYQKGLPIGKGFYNWRDFSDENIKYIKGIIDEPFNGIIKYIEQDESKKINNVDEMIDKFKSLMEDAPKLIPVFRHRYLVAADIPNPGVLSVVGSDVVVYGNNLQEYLENEFIAPEWNKRSYQEHMGVWIDIMENY